jgi:hypothetical protein
MKKTISFFFLLFVAIASAVLIPGCNNKSKSAISFYDVPLVCGAAPEIGCGSRVKPLFIETEKESKIKESWINRPGTMIAIVWDSTFTNADEQEKIMKPFFEKLGIEATRIKDDKSQEQELIASLKGKDKWYKGMDVDQLSIEEAGVIANNMVEFAISKQLMTQQEADTLKPEIENYFKGELVKVRTNENLTSLDTREKWRKDLVAIAGKHIGTDRADKISLAYKEYADAKKKNKKSCCEKDSIKKDCCKKR